MGQEKQVMVEQYFFTNILKFDMDVFLADKVSNLITPHITSLEEKNPNGQHKSDYDEDVNVMKLAVADDKEHRIEFLTNKLIELGNVYIQNTGLGSFKRYLSAWVNSYSGTEYQSMHHHCRNVNDVHGVYYVEADESMSPLIIHHPSPFMQGQAIRTQTNYASAQLKPKKGRIYMMPSWLMHEVRADSANESGRISIGFKYEQIMKDSFEDSKYIIEQQKDFDINAPKHEPYAGSAGGGKF